jgi:Zn ribbon nucleic-acid-binding protein
MRVLSRECTHLDQINGVEPSAEGCEECLQMGDAWVHLRECLICGHVGCCDSSKNKDATKHFHATEHPLVQSFQPDEDWIWCYVDEVVMEPAN